jgi:hypothetical protein
MHKLRDHKQVVFAPHIKAAEEYVRQFEEIGMRPALITGTTPKDQRDSTFVLFREGKVNPLVGCQVFTEGWDEPTVEVVSLAGKCASIGSLMQKVGRGLRPSPGKTRCVVLDLFGVTHTLGHPTMDREFRLVGEGIGGPPVERIRLNLCKRCGGAMLEDSDTCPKEGCGWTRPGLEVPKELNERLEKWEWRRAEDSDQRHGNMVRWMRAAIARGGDARKATAIAIHTYAGYYHVAARDVPRDIISRAVATITGRAWCQECAHSVRDGKCRCAKAAS